MLDYPVLREHSDGAMPSLFLSCDWGTTQFRLRLVDTSNLQVLGEVRSDDGVGPLAAASSPQNRPTLFRKTLAAQISRLAQTMPLPEANCPVVVSGMAGSSIGWTELPYATLPFPLNGRAAIWKDVDFPRMDQTWHRVLLISGLRSDNDIMRGEETQVLGLRQLSAGPLLKQEAVVLLPGTHSKHVRVRKDKVVGFETCMTGELFHVLGEHSVLRHSLPPQGSSEAAQLAGPTRQAFQEGVQAARSMPLLQQLFQVRTRRVLHGCDLEANQAFLSGLLVGAEIAALLDRCPSPSPIILCAGEMLVEAYETALRLLGAKERLHVISGADVERLAVLGQAVLLNCVFAGAGG